MQILINGSPAVLKAGSTFEYVSENLLFKEAEEYTMEISLPLAGCLQNQNIFGKVFRKDVTPITLVFDCEIRDKGFYKSGSIVITEITEAEIKVQFLGGRSAQNFNKKLDDTFINELDLGGPSITSAADVSPEIAMNPKFSEFSCVCLPWVNGSGSADIIHNEMVPDEAAGEKKLKWGADVKNITWFPYLIYIAKQICQATGFSYDFEEWENDERMKYFIVCNVLPDSWDIGGWARSLPNWSVEEFFRKLEYFLGGEFDFNIKESHISFRFTKSYDESLDPVILNDVIEVFTADITVEDPSCEYMECRNFKFKEQSFEQWKFMSCDWYIDLMRKRNEFIIGSLVELNSLEELIDIAEQYKSWNGFAGRGHAINNLYYVKSVNMFYAFRYAEKELLSTDSLGNKHWKFECFLQPVNSFGESMDQEEGEDIKEVELEFVPACIDYTDKEHGLCLFVYPGSYSENVDADLDSWEESLNSNSDNYEAPIQTTDTIRKGKKDEKPEYFNNIYLAYWKEPVVQSRQDKPLSPRPFVENVEFGLGTYPLYNDFSLRVNDGSIQKRYRGITVDKKRKHNFKFLSKVIPDPRAVFYIRGKKYLCESLTCSFSEEGRSELIKGVFWAIED